MESNSVPGKVTLSPYAAELLRAQAPSALLVSRGKVSIKGKGTLELFYLEGGTEMKAQPDATPGASSGSFARASSSFTRTPR
jgi:hypothetical protein